MPLAEDDAEVVGVPSEQHLEERSVASSRRATRRAAAYVHAAHVVHSTISVVHIAMVHSAVSHAAVIHMGVVHCWCFGAPRFGGCGGLMDGSIDDKGVSESSKYGQESRLSRGIYRFYIQKNQIKCAQTCSTLDGFTTKLSKLQVRSNRVSRRMGRGPEARDQPGWEWSGGGKSRLNTDPISIHFRVLGCNCSH